MTLVYDLYCDDRLVARVHNFDVANDLAERNDYELVTAEYSYYTDVASRPTLTAAAALDLLRSVVAGREDFVYNASPRRAITNCVYFDPVTQAPSCVVGHVFDIINEFVDGLSSFIFENLNECDVITAVVNLGDYLHLTEAATRALKEAQDQQDARVSWGHALEAAEIEARQYVEVHYSRTPKATAST